MVVGYKIVVVTVVVQIAIIIVGNWSPSTTLFRRRCRE
jgi:hypothetical protein